MAKLTPRQLRAILNRLKESREPKFECRKCGEKKKRTEFVSVSMRTSTGLCQECIQDVNWQEPQETQFDNSNRNLV